MENKDFIHYAKHKSGACIYTTKEPDGDYVLHYLNPHGYEQICGATLEKLQKGTTLQPWYVSDKIYNQLLNEIADQANGKTDVTSGDYFAPPTKEEFERKFRERIKERDKHMKWEDTVEKARKDEDNIVEISATYPDGIAFKNNNTGRIIEGIKTAVPHYYNLFYFFDESKKYIGFYKQGEWKPMGLVEIEDYALLNAVLESIDKARKEMEKDSDNIVQLIDLDIDPYLVNEIGYKDKKTGAIIEAKETNNHYDLFYFENKHAPIQYIGYYYQGEWKPEGAFQVDNYALLNAVFESIDEKVKRDKKEEREAEGLPEQDTYETGLNDGKKSAQEAQKQPRFRITLEANNEALIGSKLINDGSRTKVVQETNEETADELLRMFVDAVKGVGFQEPTVHQAVIELADEFSRYDTPKGTLHEKAQQFADEMGSQEAYDWYLSVYEFNH